VRSLLGGKGQVAVKRQEISVAAIKILRYSSWKEERFRKSSNPSLYKGWFSFDRKGVKKKQALVVW
jgi:hypothetical protein